MIKRIFIVSLFILLVGGAVGNAQPPTWDALIYDFDTNQIQQISPSGITVFASLPNFIPPLDYLPFSGVKMSGDRRYVVATYPISDVDKVVSIADVNNPNGCCIIVTPPSGGQVAEYFLGNFNESNTEIAIGYFMTDPATQNFNVSGGLMTVDLASGAITRELKPTPAESGFPVFLQEWTSEGVFYLPSCWGCEPAYEGFLTLWDVNQNALVETERYINLGFADRLEGTGEMLLAEADPDFPLSPEPGMFPYRNIIRYFQPGQIPDSVSPLLLNGDNPNPAAGQVVYFDPNNLQLPNAVWVLDGNAFALGFAERGTGAVIHRGGQVEEMLLTQDHSVLMGTPDGFLTALPSYGDTVSELYHYQVTPQGSSANLLGTMPAKYMVISAPVLGLNGTASGFVQDIAAPPPPQCPNFLPSRLRATLYGQVTPGEANNLRDAPSLSGKLVGTIPGEGIFYIIEGPVCADGTAWWHVNFEGLEGWTAEGQGSEYWTQPSGY